MKHLKISPPLPGRSHRHHLPCPPYDHLHKRHPPLPERPMSSDHQLGHHRAPFTCDIIDSVRPVHYRQDGKMYAVS